MRVLIADDSETDRKKLRKMISKEMPESEVDAAQNVREMYAKLAASCDFLFQDISLLESEGPDAPGLLAIYDVIDSFPELAIAVVTSRFYEKVRDFHDAFLGGKADQIVGFLDKLSYSEDDIVRVFLKADDLKQRLVKEKKEKLELEALFEEMLRDEEARIQKKVDEIRKDQTNSEGLDKLFKSAFSGDHWVSRIEAECKITGKYCNTNAILLCRELERVMKDLFTGSEAQCRTFYEKMQWIIGKKALPDESYTSVANAWKIRNAIVHAEKNATKQDALELETCLKFFQDI
jgi:hypothetical protein